MGTTLILALLGLAGAVLLLQRLRRRKSLKRIKVGYRKARRGVRIQPNPHPYCAVSVQAAAGACKSARALGDQRFLSVEAPPLPLPACRVKDCHCHYRFYDDRRSGDERRGPATTLTEDFSRSGTWQERHGRDRRQTAPLH